jgi:hypothetical protein
MALSMQSSAIVVHEVINYVNHAHIYSPLTIFLENTQSCGS